MHSVNPAVTVVHPHLKTLFSSTTVLILHYVVVMSAKRCTIGTIILIQAHHSVQA